MQQYLITDPSYYHDSIHEFTAYLSRVYEKHKVDFACFRDKRCSDIRMYANAFLALSEKYTVTKTLLNGDDRLAHALGFYGVHLQSTQFDRIIDAKQAGLYTIISTHTLQEAMNAQDLGVDAITYSPIFESPGKGTAKGIAQLQQVIDEINIPVFALGGILTQEQINLCQSTGAYGFASIRYFG